MPVCREQDDLRCPRRVNQDLGPIRTQTPHQSLRTQRNNQGRIFFARRTTLPVLLRRQIHPPLRLREHVRRAVVAARLRVVPRLQKRQKHPTTHQIPQPLRDRYPHNNPGNVDHSSTEQEFATSGQVVQIWSYQRTKPIYQLEWNIDSVQCVRYNPAEPNILAATCSDRSILIYDLRGETPVQKATLPNKSMCLSFNPI